MNVKTLLPLFGFLLLIACSKEDIIEDKPSEAKFLVETKEVSNNRIDFSMPAEGQISYYKRYSKACGQDNMEYTDDTLVVKVIRDGEDFYFQEDLTAGSPMKNQGFFPQPFEYLVQSKGDHFLVPYREGTQLFFFYGNDTIRLKPNHNTELIQEECYLLQDQSNFIGNDIGFLDNFSLGEVQEEKKTAVSCVPMIVEADAYLIYDQKQIYISHVIWEDEFFGDSFVAGWELIE